MLPFPQEEDLDQSPEAKRRRTQPPVVSEATEREGLRTGKWTNEEADYCDALKEHFERGSFPLVSGQRLHDFLAEMLQSKGSRLTKKFAKAKLALKIYSITKGFIHSKEEAGQFSRLEEQFFAALDDPAERQMITAHTQKEWRRRFSDYCDQIGLRIDKRPWLKSCVEEMDREVARARQAADRARQKLQEAEREAMQLEQLDQMKASEMEMAEEMLKLVQEGKRSGSSPEVSTDESESDLAAKTESIDSQRTPHQETRKQSPQTDVRSAEPFSLRRDAAALLGQHMPVLDGSTSASSYAAGFRSLRLLLLRENLSSSEHDMANLMVESYRAYVNSGRQSGDIAVLLARDFMFLQQEGPTTGEHSEDQP